MKWQFNFFRTFGKWEFTFNFHFKFNAICFNPIHLCFDKDDYSIAVGFIFFYSSINFMKIGE